MKQISAYPTQVSKQRRGYLVDVSEVYSPPRVTRSARQSGLMAGSALDLTEGWDFRRKSDRKAARRLISLEDPQLLILSPPCTVWSRLRSLSDNKRNPRVVESEKREARVHLRFAVELAVMQHCRGRGFLFEHPLGADSWKEHELNALTKLPGVIKLHVDMCAFGLRIDGTIGSMSTTRHSGSQQGLLSQKPTGLVTNIPELAHHLDKKCSKDHIHCHLLGGTARHA